jgi:hypothetical protein
MPCASVLVQENSSLGTPMATTVRVLRLVRRRVVT